MFVTFIMRLNDSIKHSSSNSVSPIAGTRMNGLCSKKRIVSFFFVVQANISNLRIVVIIEFAMLHNLKRLYGLFFLEVPPCQASC